MRFDTLYRIYVVCLTLMVCVVANVFLLYKSFVPAGSMLFCLFLIVFFYPKLILNPIKDAKVFFLYILIVTAAIFRSNLPNNSYVDVFPKAATFFGFCVNTLFILNELLKKNEIKKALYVIVIPFSILATINIIFFLLGFYQVTADNSKFASLLGISTNRVRFFFVDGVAGYGSTNGALILVSILCYYYKLFPRIINIYFILVFAAIGILTDSRGGIIYLVGALSLIGLINKWRIFRPLLYIIPVISLFSAVILTESLPLLANNQLLSTLSRGNNDLSTGSDRLVIWKMAEAGFKNGGDVTLFGFGEGGIYKTKSISELKVAFKGLEDNAGKALIHAHNSAITMILDYGMLGIIVLVILVIKSFNIIKSNWYYSPQLYSIISALLLYIFLIGMTESFVGFYYQNCFFVIFYTFCLVFALKVKKVKYSVSST